MKFIVDEQLPFQLASWLKSKRYGAIHASDLPHVLGKLTDTSICQIADAQKFSTNPELNCFKHYYYQMYTC
jgi:predicted nuclease of predicted toxin-antitoxin system